MAKSKELTKHLGLVELVFFGIGAIVGTGIFVIPAIVVNIAGVASLVVEVPEAALPSRRSFRADKIAQTHYPRHSVDNNQLFGPIL